MIGGESEPQDAVATLRVLMAQADFKESQAKEATQDAAKVPHPALRRRTTPISCCLHVHSRCSSCMLYIAFKGLKA